ncbi:MAG: hypothetical protein A2340_06920 [Lentisphaerae bacterium RIFOXYB12_FULL_60_10]|nr:MAG: hypothetical protein A2340_06920 [Lentisphaerae bacterium RIFOXYB12_FULL_60_10]
MPLYESQRGAENRIEVKPAWRDALVLGPSRVAQVIVGLIAGRADRKRPLRLSFDGWYGIDWTALRLSLDQEASKTGQNLAWRPIVNVFHAREKIDEYKRAFTETDDPGFGVVNTDGCISDLMIPEKVVALGSELETIVHADAIIVYGAGASVPELLDFYDQCFYFDKTRQPLLWEMWDGKLVPFGWDEPKPDYGWKEYYYCDYYLLDRQKRALLPRMAYWVEAIAFERIKLLPRTAYDGIIQTLLQYPIKEVPIYQPGPWGAYRYQDLGGQFDVPGLECNAWNELAGPELSMLVDIGREAMLNLPTMNLMQYADQWLGRHIAETYPSLFPMDVWLDDGYFPKPTPAERISMPIHNHPSTDYVKRHFKEALGRYETYYIAEAYEKANTWMGYTDDADIEEWERLCRESSNCKEIPNWKDFIANWETNIGDLFLIPPGTIHAHGGNQMVLEMDTCPSIAATEYSFFTYDFNRPSWDDKTKTMTGKPCNMHLDHGFDNDKYCRQSWVKDHLRARPVVVKWTKDYQFDRYTSDPRMPFEIERYHFERHADADTEGKFMHIVTLTIGREVTIRSKRDLKLANTLRKWQSALVPACFGAYEFVNADGGPCTVVQLRWKKG